MLSYLLRGPSSTALHLLGVVLVSVIVCVGLYTKAVLHAAPQHELPSSYKWLLLQDTSDAPRIIIEGGSSGHHGIDTDILARALGITAINIADNAGYDLIDKVARLERFTRAGDTVVLQLEWSYYLRDSVTDDYLSALFTALPEYLTTLSITDSLWRAMSVPATVLWSAYKADKSPAPVLSTAQQLEISRLQGASGHVSFASARTPAAGVEGQSCDSYLFSSARTEKGLDLSPLFLTALHRLTALKARGVRVIFAWPIVVGDDCYTSDIGLPQLHEKVRSAVQSAGFSFVGAMQDTHFGSALRDDTPYHLITAGALKRTELLIAALRSQGVVGSGALDLASLMHADILDREARMPDPSTLSFLPVDGLVSLATAAETQLRFTAGWWQTEATGRWMRGKEAMLTLVLDPALPQEQMLTMAGFTFDGQRRQLAVYYDGQLLGQAAVSGDFALPVLTTAVPRGRPVRLILRLMDDAPVQSPSALGRGDDLRSLSLHLRSLSLAPNLPVATVLQNAGVSAVPPQLNCPSAKTEVVCQPPPNLTSDAVVSNLAIPARLGIGGTTSQSQVKLTGGWWGPEADGRWIGSQDAAITVHPKSGQGAIGLRIMAQPFHVDRQPIKISVAGKILFTGDLVGAKPVEVILPASFAGQDVTLTLHFPDSTPHCPSSLGLAEDQRDLLAFVTQIETFASTSGL